MKMAQCKAQVCLSTMRAQSILQTCHRNRYFNLSVVVTSLFSPPVSDLEIVVCPISLPHDLLQVGHALVDLVQPLLVGQELEVVLVGLLHGKEHVALLQQDEPVRGGLLQMLRQI